MLIENPAALTGPTKNHSPAKNSFAGPVAARSCPIVMNSVLAAASASVILPLPGAVALLPSAVQMSVAASGSARPILPAVGPAPAIADKPHSAPSVYLVAAVVARKHSAPSHTDSYWYPAPGRTSGPNHVARRCLRRHRRSAAQMPPEYSGTKLPPAAVIPAPSAPEAKHHSTCPALTAPPPPPYRRKHLSSASKIEQTQTRRSPTHD